MIALIVIIIGTFLLGGYAIKKGQELETKERYIEIWAKN